MGIGAAASNRGRKFEGALNAHYTCMNTRFCFVCVFFWCELRHLRLNNNHIHRESKRTATPLPPAHPPISRATVLTQQLSSSLCLPAKEGTQQSQARCRSSLLFPWRPTTDTAVGKKKQKTRKENCAVFFFVFATVELFIVEADETAVLMLFPLPFICFLLCVSSSPLPHGARRIHFILSRGSLIYYYP